MLFKNAKLVDENFVVRKDMYLRTKGTLISYIGNDVPPKIEGEEMYDAKNKLLLPGFYNAHCHVPMTILRGYGEGLPLSRWLNERIFPFEAHLDGDSVYAASKLGALELIAGGAASISDQYFFIEDIARALFECGMKANLCHGLSDFDPKKELSTTKGFKDTLSLKKRVKRGDYCDGNSESSLDTDNRNSGGSLCSDFTNESRIKVDMGLHSEYTSCEEFIKRVSEAAIEEGLNIHTHISETRKEHEECKGRHGGRTPVEFLLDCGIFKSKVQAAHCVYLEDHDIEIMKTHGAFVVHNPSSNMKLGSGIMPIKKYMEAGLKLGLGTDGASSNNSLNMMKEIHMAAMLSRVGSLDANALSPAEVLKMASLNGALTQGRENAGLLKEGYRADIIVIDLDKPHMQPDFDTLSNVVFSAQNSDIVLNMIDGRIVYKNGEFIYADEERIIHDANAAFSDILSKL